MCLIIHWHCFPVSFFFPIGRGSWEKLLQPITSISQIWVVTRHQYGISGLVSQTSVRRETSGGVAKCRLFTPATRSRVIINTVVPESDSWKARIKLLNDNCMSKGLSVLKRYKFPYIRYVVQMAKCRFGNGSNLFVPRYQIVEPDADISC